LHNSNLYWNNELLYLLFDVLASLIFCITWNDFWDWLPMKSVFTALKQLWVWMKHILVNNSDNG
jgi:hypothetical protein